MSPRRSVAMNRCKRTTERYTAIRSKISTAQSKGKTKKDIFKKFNLTPSRYYAICHKKNILAPHTWNETEERCLLERFTVDPYNWDAIANTISEKCKTVLVDEQVKNKFYNMKKSLKYKEIIAQMKIPRTHRGRRKTVNCLDSVQQLTAGGRNSVRSRSKTTPYKYDEADTPVSSTNEIGYSLLESPNSKTNGLLLSSVSHPTYTGSFQICEGTVFSNYARQESVSFKGDVTPNYCSSSYGDSLFILLD